METWDWLLPLILVSGGFLAGFINTLAGSGSFISLPLLIFCGLDPVMANGTNRIAVTLQNIAAVTGFYRKKFLNINEGFVLSVPSVIGSVAGAFIAVEIDKDMMGKIIGLIMLLMLIPLIIQIAGRNSKIKTPCNFKGKRIVEGVIFFLIGVYGGFIQAGVGIFLLLALTWFSGHELMGANALKLMINLMFTLAALIIFIWHMKVDVWFGLFLSAGNIAGAIVASRTAFRHGAGIIRWMVVFAIVGSAVKLLFFP